MGDQNDGGIQLGPKIAQQGKDFRLYRHIQRRCRLVGDQNLRFACKGDGNHHPLTLTTRQLVRIIINPCRCIGNPHRLEQFQCAPAGRCIVNPAMQAQHFDDLLANGKNRVERGHRLLKDHRDLIAPQAPQPCRRCLRQIFALEQDLPARNAPHGRQQTHQRKRSHRLATAGLADKTDALAAFECEGNIIQNGNGAGTGGELNAEIADVQKWCVCSGFCHATAPSISGSARHSIHHQSMKSTTP